MPLVSISGLDLLGSVAIPATGTIPAVDPAPDPEGSLLTVSNPATAPEQSQYSNPQKTEIMVKRYIEKILNHDISAHALYSISEEAEQIIRNESESVK